jgi:hypothetical protein
MAAAIVSDFIGAFVTLFVVVEKDKKNKEK